MPKKKKDKLEAGEYQLAVTKKDEKKSPYVLLDLTGTLKTKIAQVILEQVKEADTNKERKAFIDHCDYCRKRYTMEDLDTDFPWENASKRRTGGTTIATDRLTPRIKRALYYSGNIIGITPGKDVAEEDSERQEKWLDYLLREDMQIEEKSENLLYDAIMLNFGVAKNYWHIDEEQKEEVVTYESAQELLRNYPDALEKYPQYILKLTGYRDINSLLTAYPEALEGDYDLLPQTDVKVTLREKFVQSSTGQKIEWVDPKDIIFPKNAKDSKDPWIVIQKLKMRRDELLKKKASGFFENVDEIFANKDKEDKDHDKEYTIYEAILKYNISKDKKGGLEEKCVYWIAEGGHEKEIYLRGIKFPYTHGENYFVVYRTSSRRYGFYTGGLGYKLKSVNESEDMRVNQISNAWQQAIVKAWKHIKMPGSPFNPNVQRYYPGATITLSDPNELTELGMSDLPNSSFNLLEDNRREGETLVGFPFSLTSGQITPQDPNAPAKKSEILLAEANISVSEYLKVYIRGLKQTAKQAQFNYYQFRNDDEMDFRDGKKFNKISKQQMIAKGAMTCKSALESVDSQERARSTLMLLGQLQQYPMISENLSAQHYLIKTIIDNWDENFARSTDKLFPEGIELLIQEQIKKAQELAQQEEEAKANKGKIPAILPPQQEGQI
jgi:hypothetical protein